MFDFLFKLIILLIVIACFPQIIGLILAGLSILLFWITGGLFILLVALSELR
tara:strand:- start:492 stop:647 length:156 start_codon:yes stop_codon:yes gene_type:complete